MLAILYDLLEGFITARYARNKLAILEPLSSKLDILGRFERIGAARLRQAP
jgi:hypothetical protein